MLVNTGSQQRDNKTRNLLRPAKPVSLEEVVTWMGQLAKYQAHGLMVPSCMEFYNKDQDVRQA